MNKFNKYTKIIMLIFIIILVSCTQDDQEINVMSYNIRTWSNYKQSTPQRVDTLMHKWDIDILGTQELHIEQIHDIDSLLTDYNWFGVARDDGDKKGEFCAIFYKTKGLELNDHGTFWLSETPKVVGSRSWNTACTRIVTWGKFQCKSDKQIFYHFNTHFDHESKLARKESAKIIREKISEIARGNPVILTGDFNCIPNSSPYNILTNKGKSGFILNDSKKISKQSPFGSEGTSNSFKHLNPDKRIDYIFVNQLFMVNCYGVINEKFRGKFISDHFPVYAQVELN